MSGRFVDEEWPPEHSGLHAPVPYRAWLPDPMAESQIRYTPDDVVAAAQSAKAIRRFCTDPETRTSDWLLRVAEGCASTTIEGIHPSPRRLLRAQFTGRGKKEETAAIANVDTVARALAIGDDARDRPLTLRDVQDMHKTLADRLPDYAWVARHQPGSLRRSQNWIAGSYKPRSDGIDYSPAHRSVVYVPPPPGEVVRLMEDLVDFCNRTDIPPILHAAVAHARFEEIHPFPDGNGRTGRALVQTLLCKHGLVEPTATVPISLTLAARRHSYIDALAVFHSPPAGFEDDQPHDPIVRLFLTAAQRSLERARLIHDHAQRQVSEWRRAPAAPRQHSLADQVLGNMAVHPAVDPEMIAERYHVNLRRAQRVVHALVRSGVVAERNVGSGVIAYEANDMVAVLREAFSESIYTDADVPANEAEDYDDPPNSRLDPLPITPWQPERSRRQCAKLMPRAHKRCVLSSGHAGQCRSVKPW